MREKIIAAIYTCLEESKRLKVVIKRNHGPGLNNLARKIELGLIEMSHKDIVTLRDGYERGFKEDQMDRTVAIGFGPDFKKEDGGFEAFMFEVAPEFENVTVLD